MHLYNLTLAKPSAVHLAVFGNFSSARQQVRHPYGRAAASGSAQCPHLPPPRLLHAPSPLLCGTCMARVVSAPPPLLLPLPSRCAAVVHVTSVVFITGTLHGCVCVVFLKVFVLFVLCSFTPHVVSRCFSASPCHVPSTFAAA